MTKEQFQRRYAALAHAVQSGAATERSLDEAMLATGSQQPASSPKMLRTGVDMAMVEQSAVVKLLIAKGVFGESEYFQSLIVALEAEVERYEQHLSKRIGSKVTLG